MTSKNTLVRWAGVALACIALVACGGGGSGDGDTPASPPPVTALIGAAGGTVTGPNDATVVIPAGALATDIDITVAQTNAGAPALPTGVTAFGATFAFTPHGTTFATPVTVTVPFDPALVPAGVQPALYKTNAGEQAFEPVAGASVVGSALVAQVSSFSLIVAGSPPVNGVQRLAPKRSWTFENEVSGGIETERGPKPSDPGGVITESRNFGSGGFNFDGDGQTTLDVFSSANGVTFWASAEDVGTATLDQSQKFIKRAANATLEFVITAGSLKAADGNQLPSATTCPRGTAAAVCHPIMAQILFQAEAVSLQGDLLFDAGGEPILHTGGTLALGGHTSIWEIEAFASALHTTQSLKLGNFITDTGQLRRSPSATLAGNIVLRVDLSRLDVGDAFRVNTTIVARAVNGSGRESAVAAYVRDPARVGGAAMNFSGLEAVDTTDAPPPALRPKAGACPGVPTAAAGTLQFSATTFAVLEERFAGSVRNGIQVTRSGGSQGAVSVKFDSGGGTATPGLHYEPLSAHIHFPDGDTTPRFVPLEVLPNTVAEPDKTVNLTLSDVAGCAVLGPQATAVLTILDDELAPPPPPPSGLDPSFGIAGQATMPETGTPPSSFGGDRSAMALQADGKIVMAGGTGEDFILARFNADGSLDRDFGIEGKVVTDMGSDDFTPEEALGVAIQADGKIVVVGHATIPTSPPAPRLPPTFALTRYDSRGNMDDSFGTGGRVSGNVNGRAHAVAIQPDGKIVVAGEFSFESNVTGEGSDITVARFNSNGTLDLGFGGSGTGQLASDIGGRVNTARQVVLQPDGRIVVSGTPISNTPHTDLMRFNANGLPDSSFGGSGKLTILGSDVGQGLALQPDGKLVLLGTVVNPVSPATSRFLLRRLNADGTPDGGFGSAGIVDTALSVNASAGGLALQADGRIVVVGTRALSANSNFVVARYATDGALDTGFGIGGTLSIDFFQFTDIGENVLVQPDGKILVSGSAQRPASDGYGLARINP
jgi:uncharacterized delta-60 repeat protein